MALDHSNGAFNDLRNIVDRNGGAVAVVCGSGDLLQAGIRRAPVRTVLEAILAIMGDRSVYERIAVFSGRGSHLPSNLVFGRFRVGESSGGWMFRGEKPAGQSRQSAAPATPEKSRLPMKDFTNRFKQPDRVFFQQSDGKWLVQVEKLLDQLELLVSQDVPRTLILLDETLLRPREVHLRVPDILDEETHVKIAKRLNSLPDLLHNTQVDLVLFTCNPKTGAGLNSGSFLQDDVRDYLKALRPNQQLDQSFYEHHELSRALPSMHWKPFVHVVLSAVEAGRPQGVFLPNADPTASLLDSLRQTVLRESSAIDELNTMVGLDGVKKQVEKLIRFAETQSKRAALGISTESINLNMAFSGNPGTGKTEVARILGRALADLKLLSGVNFTEVTATDLIGQYLGSSRQKARECCEKAMGGVLFIDEAYDLAPSHTNPYAAESVVEMLVWMNNHPRDIAFILAGYPEQMETLFKTANPGLRRRVPHHIRFPDYDDATLVEICRRMCCKKDYILSADCLEAIRKKLSECRAVRKRSGLPFGNAGEVKNILENAILNQAERVVSCNTREELQAIEAVDFLSVKLDLESLP